MWKYYKIRREQYNQDVIYRCSGTLIEYRNISNNKFYKSLCRTIQDVLDLGVLVAGPEEMEKEMFLDKL